MSRKRISKLVIDASVAKASGGNDAIFPTSKKCRDFLNEVILSRHYLVMSDAIRQEWNRHQSRYASSWRATMVAKRLLHYIDIDEDTELREQISQSATCESHRRAMLKDCILVEAAHNADNIVTSLDEQVRHCYIHVSLSISGLRTLIWVNPDKDDEYPIEWVKKGAHPDKHRQLGESLGK
jgi:hypothetical protein